MEDRLPILKEQKTKNSVCPVTTAHLNINSLLSKFEPLTNGKRQCRFLLVTGSKLDKTFPKGQFQIEGLSRLMKLERNRNGGGLIVFTSDGLSCRELKPCVLYPELECTFLEVCIRHNKQLVHVGYNTKKENIS